MENQKFTLMDATSGNYTALRLLNLFYDRNNFKGYYFTHQYNKSTCEFNVSGFMDRRINNITIEFIMFALKPQAMRMKDSKPVYGMTLPMYFENRDL